MKIYSYKLLKNEKGSTLIENLVAFSILTGVIILLTGITFKLLSRADTQKMVEAESIGQKEMELTLFNNDFFDYEYNINNKWNIVRKIKKNKNKITIFINVYYKEELYPAIELKTVRLIQKSVDFQ